ncbi:Aromatic prenyltransferase [Naviculisporaceae sp. PSN 640]
MGSIRDDTGSLALDGPAYWYATSGQDLERMMRLANVPKTAQHSFLNFYRNILCPALGEKPQPSHTPNPTHRGSLLGWDGNPFEYSFEFKGSTKKAAVRFSADFTQHRPNDTLNPLGMSHSRDIIEYLRPRTPGFDSTWNDAFRKFFSVEDLSAKEQETLITKVGHQTPLMLGFDIKPSMLDSSPTSNGEEIVPVMLKSYYMPHYTTIARQTPNNFETIKASIQQLPGVAKASPNILKALTVLEEYLSTKPDIYKQSGLFMATDFISPTKARLKIYFRFHNPDPAAKDYMFEDIWVYYTLGGRIPGLEGDKDMLRDLIDFVESHWKSDQVRMAKTRRKPVVLYFSLTPDKPYPTPKLYYNPARSSKLPDDLAIARGIDAWMDKYGWADGGLTVEERIKRVFTHRRLEEKNGIFTFVAFGQKEDGGKTQTSLSVYVTPELYENPQF